MAVRLGEDSGPMRPASITLRVRLAVSKSRVGRATKSTPVMSWGTVATSLLLAFAFPLPQQLARQVGVAARREAEIPDVDALIGRVHERHGLEQRLVLLGEEAVGHA